VAQLTLETPQYYIRTLRRTDTFAIDLENLPNMSLKRSNDHNAQPLLNAQNLQQTRSHHENHTSDAPCLFFTLPRELRDEIYHFALGNLCNTFMYGKAQVRATYGGHKGFFEDTHRQQLKWIRTSRQIHKEATDQFYRLARFELDFDTRHELLYSDGSRAPNKVANERGSKAPNKFPNGLRLTRTRDLVVVNVDMYLDLHNKHLRSLTNLLPRMHALRSLSIDIKLNIPPLDGESGIDASP
jgi:hypothetical protein